LGGQHIHARVWEHPWLVRVVEAPELERVSLPEEDERKLPDGLTEQMRKVLAFRYPCQGATCAPSKQTATQRKGRIKDQEAAENAPEPKFPTRSWRKPSFADAAVQGKTYGSAVHAVMQHIRYQVCTDAASVCQEVQRLVAEKFISQELAELVDCVKIAAFFATPLGEKLRNSDNVLREFKFSILDDGSAYDADLAGEKILLQGVVDCALVEPDGITVVDFKTDRVTEDTVSSAAERYRPQVEAYADALSRIFQMKVKKICLYFFRLERLVDM
jgi:ATP-dependent helicase/nuclease subunit A